MKAKWGIVSLIWLMMLVAYMDRVNISLAIPNVTAELHLGKAEMGLVLGSFSLGYAFLQVPGGWLSDRFGSKPLLVAALLLWSLFTGITGLCYSLTSLIAARAMFGASEGLENGPQFKLIGDHFNERERSRANGVFLSSLALGPAIATPISVWLIRTVGWRQMFFTFAAVGVVVAVILFLFLPTEKAANEHQSLNLREWLRRPMVLVLLSGYLLFNVAFWGFVGWTPTYLREQRHISLADLGWKGAVPYLCGFLGLLLVGQLGSQNLFGRRNFLVAGCYIAAAVSLFLGLSAYSQLGCLIGLSCAAFFLYSAFAPFWALAIDLAAPNERGGLTGLINFGGQLGGFVGQFVIGLVADKMHSFNGAISLMSFSLLAGAAVLFSFKESREPLLL